MPIAETIGMVGPVSVKLKPVRVDGNVYAWEARVEVNVEQLLNTEAYKEPVPVLMTKAFAKAVEAYVDAMRKPQGDVK